MRRNSHLIGLRRGHKYDFDRYSWAMYANFDHVYRHNYSKMVSVGAAEVLETLEWHDK